MASRVINDEGLVFDGFAMPHLEIKKFEEKDSPEHEDILQFIMKLLIDNLTVNFKQLHYQYQRRITKRESYN